MGPSCLVLSCLVLSCLSCLVLSCLVFSRGRLRDRDRRRGSSTAYCVSSRHTPHSAPLSSLSRLAPPLFAVAICPCARRVSLVLGPRAFALGLWCLHPRFVPSFRFVACLRVLALFGAFGLCFHLGSRSPASIRGSFSFSACAFVGVSWGLVTCFRCSAGRGPLPSAFAFVFGFWLRSRFLASFSAFAFVFDSCFCCPSACLRYSCPLRVFPRFRLVPLLSAYAFAACAFDLGLCFCSRLVPSLLRPGFLSAFVFDI